ncbi:MAG: hypothetical protein ACREUC_21390, partial [Steroidobacteraceae bacterium]
MNVGSPTFHAADVSFEAAGIALAALRPLIDGELLDCGAPRVERASKGSTITWPVRDARRGREFVVRVVPHGSGPDDGLRLEVSVEGIADASIDSIGVRIGKVSNVLRYLRNGYTSWDGSYFVEPDGPLPSPLPQAGEGTVVGHAMTALVAGNGGTAVLGFLRHDRFQSRLRFAMTAGSLSIDVETLIDQVPHSQRIAAEALVLLAGDAVESTLRRWAHAVAAASDPPPRIRSKRISG